MDTFEAITIGSNYNVYKEYDRDALQYVPEEYVKAFRAGEQLTQGRMMIITADSYNEFQRDIDNYNATVENINEMLGYKSVIPYPLNDSIPEAIWIIQTKEEVEEKQTSTHP